MKHKDLEVGGSYYYAAPHTWRDGGGILVEVVDRTRYTIRPRTGESYYEDPKGSAVLVDAHTHSSGIVLGAVQVAHLRGPYDETKAAVDAACTQNRGAAEHLRVAAAVIGVPVFPVRTLYDRVSVRTADLADMVAALRNAGWHRDNAGWPESDEA